MKCSFCKNKAVYSNFIKKNKDDYKRYYKKKYCKEHFIKYFEKKVLETIKKFNLINKKDKVCVAVSGGKDSSSLLYLLNKLGYNVYGLAIDEGIKDYRDKTLFDLKKLCEKFKIKLKIVSFKDNFGFSLDEIVLKEKRACSACGILRRRLLNFYSKNFDVIATGHNLDDESQAIIMNLFKGNIELLKRLGPITGVNKKDNIEEGNIKEYNIKNINGFTKRVKPFYFCTEKEILIYSFLNKLEISYNECPYVYNSFRAKIRDYLNDLEDKKKGTKLNIVNWFLRLKFKIKDEKIKYCKICNEPSSKDVCNVCLYIEKLKKK